MKYYFLVVTLLVLASRSTSPAGESIFLHSPFIQQVNAAWKAKNDDEIPRLANAQAVKSSNDPEPLVILSTYDVLVKGNSQRGVQELNQLIELLKTVRPSKVAGVQAYRDKIVEKSGNNLTDHGRTPQQLEKLHEVFPNEFPANALLILIFVPDPALKLHPPVSEDER